MNTVGVKPQDLPHLLTVRDAARILKMSENAIYLRLHRGEMPCLRFGRRTIRFVYDELVNWGIEHGKIRRRKCSTSETAGMATNSRPRTGRASS